jgi:hypothetical protein
MTNSRLFLLASCALALLACEIVRTTSFTIAVDESVEILDSGVDFEGRLLVLRPDGYWRYRDGRFDMHIPVPARHLPEHFDVGVRRLWSVANLSSGSYELSYPVRFDREGAPRAPVHTDSGLDEVTDIAVFSDNFLYLAGRANGHGVIISCIYDEDRDLCQTHDYQQHRPDTGEWLGNIVALDVDQVNGKVFAIVGSAEGSELLEYDARLSISHKPAVSVPFAYAVEARSSVVAVARKSSRFGLPGTIELFSSATNPSMRMSAKSFMMTMTLASDRRVENYCGTLWGVRRLSGPERMVLDKHEVCASE